MINCLIKACTKNNCLNFKRDESHIQESQGKDAHSSTTTTTAITTTQKTSEFDLFSPL